MPRAELYVGELLLKLIGRQTGEISKVDYEPQKRAFNSLPYPDEEFLERTTPESQGVSSAFFADLIKELSEDKDSHIHKFIALRHGRVIAECAFYPYDMDMWHVTYSMCKSITGMAIGLLISEKKLSLEDRLSDIFGARMGTFNMFKRPITVKNLLDMSSGVEFNEAGAVSGNDWRKGFFESPVKFEPGTKFEYNSMNSYMLSAIVTEITGQSLFDFCRERIFDPMGIKRVFWESCPQSITKGGWGLFMRAEDMAKLGVMYLNNGVYNGKRIIPRQWIVESTAWQIVTDSEDNPHYGYQIWINDDRKGSYAFNGMLGQNVFVYPDLDMVIVTNAGNREIFQTSNMALKVRAAMKELKVSDEPLPEESKASERLRRAIVLAEGKGETCMLSITGGGWRDKSSAMTSGSTRRTRHVRRAARPGRISAFPPEVFLPGVLAEGRRGPVPFGNIGNTMSKAFLKRISDSKYDLETTGVGIFPIMMQVVHNNFTDGIRSIGFRLESDRAFFMDIYEGENIFRLRCSFSGKRYVSDINMHGENYKVAVKSCLTRDEYGRAVLRNEIYFLEEACLRILNVYFEDNQETGPHTAAETEKISSAPSGIEVRFFETPGTDMLKSAIESLATDGIESANPFIARFMKGGMKEALSLALTGTMQPVARGKPGGV